VAKNSTSKKIAEVMPSNLPRITVYLDEDTKKQLEALAKLEDRPASNFVLVLIKKAIDQAKQEGRID
jgi:tartrate dehydratase alpha subunit/fumarate hydratase class I-like protein